MACIMSNLPIHSSGSCIIDEGEVKSHAELERDEALSPSKPLVVAMLAVSLW